MALTVDNVLRNPDFNKASTIFEFRARDLRGNIVSLDAFTGKVCLFVNVASRSAFTESWYKLLNELHSTYSERGLRILAFPCNQFDEGEPGTDAEILDFIQQRQVQFQVFAKVDVNSTTASPVWKFLKYKLPLEGKKGISVITTNFHVFLVARNGLPNQRFTPDVDPEKVKQAIEMYLGDDVANTPKDSGKDDVANTPKDTGTDDVANTPKDTGKDDVTNTLKDTGKDDVANTPKDSGKHDLTNTLKDTGKYYVTNTLKDTGKD